MLSHALRHEPWLYELELDADGWVPIDDVIVTLRRLGPRWRDVDRADLERMIATADKARHEMRGDLIRASYGHSLPGRIEHEPAPPPNRLFHGTDPAAVGSILDGGLRPMERQYVHLSPDVETAIQVGLRKARPCAVIVVDAAGAAANGISFFRGNDKVWLTGPLPPKHLRLLEGTENRG